ncbi:amidohydrolase family protein [Nocardioides islandensis]|uniref:Amidohydrolase family protein n=1 Tax=Nocardioides islandensis TaxID=433663 RepID=A0A930VLI1_9ACTN|nr:amidohydrolase family protein [Nocardioides islandensis]MBF4766075.1 amidohydrolase family protein [Nocardioides islandensis]
MERVEADLLIPGRGAPLRDGVVILDGETIAYAGPAAGAPQNSDGDPIRVAVAMPGLWDCHGHLLGVRSLDLSRVVTDPSPLRAARCAHDLRAALDAGVTSVREMGGLGVYLSQAVAEGLLEGPAIYGAGAILGTTGGHADVHQFPQAWLTDFGHSGGDLRQCDGVDECVRAVREQLRRNAKLIKVCASGGVLSEVDDPLHQQFTVAELRAIVEVAALAERVVAAHCHGKPGMLAALEAGVRTIEHGTYLDEEVCDAMRETGALLVPTRTIIAETLVSDHLPPYAKAKMAAIADRHAAAVAMAHERGVTIAAGTDIAYSGRDLPASWGRNGRELPLLVEAGMTPLEAVEAATANGPMTLGPQAPRSGILAEGFDADLIALDRDPLRDILVLADPGHIIGVWRAGRRVKR